MKFFSKDFFIKCDQIRKKLRIWSPLLKKSLMENFIFSAVISTLHEEKVEFSRSIKKYMILKQFLEVLEWSLLGSAVILKCDNTKNSYKKTLKKKKIVIKISQKPYSNDFWVCDFYTNHLQMVK